MTSTVEQGLIDYLRGKTKGKLLMSPEQLSEEIGIPTKAIQAQERRQVPHSIQEYWQIGLLLNLRRCQVSSKW